MAARRLGVANGVYFDPLGAKSANFASNGT